MSSVSLIYDGGLSRNHVIDFYDASRGLAGFQRSLALTAHLVLNGEIITQAPALRGAQILVSTPEASSWKVTASLVTSVVALSLAPRGGRLENILFSAYDYVVSDVLGFTPDYDEVFVKEYSDNGLIKNVSQSKLQSLAEKIEPSISDIHRPIIASQTALSATLVGHRDVGGSVQIGPEMTESSYDYISKTRLEEKVVPVDGVVSSFNKNTFKGRIYVFSERRPIPFELADSTRSSSDLVRIASSLREGIRSKMAGGAIRFKVQRLVTSTGRLKAIIVNDIELIDAKI